MFNMNLVQLIKERRAWSAALFNQHLPWTIQFPLDGPESPTQPQSAPGPQRRPRRLRGPAPLEELLNPWPQPAGLGSEHEGHVKGRDQGGIYCYLVHSAQGALVPPVHAQVDERSPDAAGLACSQVEQLLADAVQETVG